MKAKLTLENYQTARKMMADGCYNTDIARVLNLSEGAVSRIRNNKYEIIGSEVVSLTSKKLEAKRKAQSYAEPTVLTGKDIDSKTVEALNEEWRILNECIRDKIAEKKSIYDKVGEISANIDSLINQKRELTELKREIQSEIDALIEKKEGFWQNA